MRSYKFSEHIFYSLPSPLKHLDIPVRKFIAAVCLIDDLGDPNDVALVIADRHRQNQCRFVSGSHVNSAVESRILMNVNRNTYFNLVDEDAKLIID